MSPAAKLCGFLLLLAVIFIGAYAAGAHLGPVTVGSPSSGTSSPGRANPGRREARAAEHGRAGVTRATGGTGGDRHEHGRAVSDMRTGETGERDADRGNRGRDRRGRPELIVGGMSCSACAARIERQLNRLDGVTATVSYATERAYVTSSGRPRPGRADRRDRGWLPRPPAPAADADELAATGPAGAAPAAGGLPPAGRRDHSPGDGSRRAVPRLAVVSLVLAGAGRDLGRMAAAPGRLAWPRPRRRDDGHAGQPGSHRVIRLVAVGAAGFGGAGSRACGCPFPDVRGGSGSTLYLEVAAGVTAAVLAGRYLEARAKNRSGRRADRAGRARRQDRRCAARRR